MIGSQEHHRAGELGGCRHISQRDLGNLLIEHTLEFDTWSAGKTQRAKTETLTERASAVLFHCPFRNFEGAPLAADAD